MENASKALIIAGAILLAILLITLGILVYNQAAGVINSNAMSDVEIQQFNQKFLQYSIISKDSHERFIYPYKELLFILITSHKLFKQIINLNLFAKQKQKETIS